MYPTAAGAPRASRPNPPARPQLHAPTAPIQASSPGQAAEGRDAERGFGGRLAASRRMVGVLWVFACTLWAFGAGAVVIDSGDGAGNTTPPPDDPGWAHVGTQDFKTVVYVGNGWVLTAVHVGVGDVEISGVVYPAVPDSRVVFTNDDKTAADLMAFRIEGDPGLPVLPISRSTPRIGADVVLAGHGRDRGSFLTWNPSPSLDTAGWNLLGSRTLRWGTNKIESTPSSVVVGNKTTTSMCVELRAPLPNGLMTFTLFTVKLCMPI